MPNKSLKTKRFSVMKLVWVQHIVMDLTCIIMHVRHYAYGETVAQEVEWLSWDRKGPGGLALEIRALDLCRAGVPKVGAWAP